MTAPIKPDEFRVQRSRLEHRSVSCDLATEQGPVTMIVSASRRDDQAWTPPRLVFTGNGLVLQPAELVRVAEYGAELFKRYRLTFGETLAEQPR